MMIRDTNPRCSPVTLAVYPRSLGVQRVNTDQKIFLTKICVYLCLSVVSILILSACGSRSSQETPVQPAALPSHDATSPVPRSSPTPVPTSTITPTPSQTPTPTQTYTPTPDTRPDPQLWGGWQIVPTVSGVANEIYQRGLANGNDPHVFSVIGDCQSEPNVFLGYYETQWYVLSAKYKYLQETIDYFKGSFSRKSLAVRDGMSAPTALSALWADKESCQPDESPVACELRVRKPAIIFINLGTNWRPDASPKAYEKYLRQIVDLVIASGTLPVLSTKADNVEGNNGINLVTAQVAHDYDIPVLNFWLAANNLPNHGLDEARKNIYLTPDGWDLRNFTALETLDALRKALGSKP